MCCVNDSNYLSSGKLMPSLASPAKRNIRDTKRHVSFDETELAGRRMLSSHLSDRDGEECWYQHAELASFKDNARDLCRKIRSCDEFLDKPIFCFQMDEALESESECVRGLEQRISMERQKNKYLAMRTILKFQDRCNSSEKLAAIASKCTAWAKDVALCTGYQDFYNAYNPSLAHLAPLYPSVKFPILIRKRSDEDFSDEEPICLKRQRTLSPMPLKHLENNPPQPEDILLLPSNP
jgi:hypothetical protein